MIFSAESGSGVRKAYSADSSTFTAPELSVAYHVASTAPSSTGNDGGNNLPATPTPGDVGDIPVGVIRNAALKLLNEQTVCNHF